MTITYCAPTAASDETTATAGGAPVLAHQHHHHQRVVKHKRRYCKTPGCTKIVKSQGKCQRHGAVAKKCKVEGCPKQAQGNFNRMCKSHYSASLKSSNHGFQQQQQPPPSFGLIRSVAAAAPTTMAAQPQPQPQFAPVGVSVYEAVLPASVGFVGPPKSSGDPTTAEDDDVMPLVRHLRDGARKPAGWHRAEERRARGLLPAPVIAAADDREAPLDDWERELAWTETLVLSGSSPEAFAHLARAWGHDDGDGGQLLGSSALRSQFWGTHTQAAPPAVAAPPANALSAPPAIVNFGSSDNNSDNTHHPKISKHLRVSTMDIAFAWSYDDDRLASGILEEVGEFDFENLQEEMEGLSGDDESTTDGEETTEPPYEDGIALVCPPCNGYAARQA